MSKWRRFEVLLPLQLNDGSAVPLEWIGEATDEIVDHFDAASLEPQTITGVGGTKVSNIATTWCDLSLKYPTPSRTGNG